MGKFRTNSDLASRLSITTSNKPKFINRINDTRNYFKSDRFNNNYLKQDARLNLTARITNSAAVARYEQNKMKNFDAREVLRNNNIGDYKSKLTNKKEPTVIVTGLGNVIHKDNRVRIAPNRSSSSSKQHYVINDGVNTLVTLKNDLVKRKDSNSPQASSPSSSSSSRRKNRNGFKYEEIFVSIKNDTKPSTKNSSSSSITDQNMDFEANIKKEPLPNNNRMFTSNNNFNYSQKPVHNQVLIDNSVPSINYNNNNNNDINSKSGYTLTISNLHYQVTEQDLLELFSNIGPLKRAPSFITKGMAEAVYVKLEDAKKAIETYDQKGLDGQLMVIGFADQKHSDEAKRLRITQNQQEQISNNMNINNHQNSDDEEEEVFANLPRDAPLSSKFKLITGNKDMSKSIQLPESRRHDLSLDNSIIHQVLFNQKPNNKNQKPVTFTVKL